MKRILFLLFALALPALAFAAAPSADANFLEFYRTINDWASGPLGVGLATTMLLMGGALGVAKNSPMPALSGVMGAAFLHWGPGIIATLMVPPGTDPGTLTNPPVVASVPASATAASGVPASAARVASATASVQVASAPAAASAVPQTVAAPVVQVAKTATQTASVDLPTHSAALPHTVPVPAAAVHPVHPALDAKAVGSSDLMVWLGAAGAAIIVGLLGLFAFASSRRKSANPTGYSASPAPTTAASAFTDPHGFTRQKPTSSFKP